MLTFPGNVHTFSGLRLSSSPHIGAPLASFEKERVENLATDPKFRNLGRGINIKICIEAQGTGHGIDQRVLISGVGCSFFFFFVFFSFLFFPP